MSKIRNAKGRSDGNSGYTRVIGNAALGQLLSRVQATVISNGNELERMIAERCNLIDNIDDFIEKATDGEIENGVFLCLKKIFKQSKIYKQNIEPDLLVFIVEKKRVCKVIELKDGDNFDTKKSGSEQANLATFAKEFGSQIPFVTDYFICSFNQENKELIYQGFKGYFSMEHILTGRELCELLKIDYDEIIAIRKQDIDDNFPYLIEEMLKIPEVLAEIKKHL